MMKQKTYTETANFGFTVMPPDSWQKKLLEIRRQGLAKSADLRNEGRAFCVEILGSREVPTTAVPLSAALLDLDWRLAAKLEMAESARDFITNACALDCLDGALPTVLKAIIEGRGLYEYSIGEFFLLYGKFEQKHNTQGRRTREKMEELVGGDNQHMKSYIDHGNTQVAPLPYVVSVCQKTPLSELSCHDPPHFPRQLQPNFVQEDASDRSGWGDWWWTGPDLRDAAIGRRSRLLGSGFKG